jgi:concentrative nucleoside transporter, CNT family
VLVPRSRVRPASRGRISVPGAPRLIALAHLVNTALGSLPDIAGAAARARTHTGDRDGANTLADGNLVARGGASRHAYGLKTILNGFVADLELAALPPDVLRECSRLITLYGMRRFANFGGLGIMIGRLYRGAGAA